MLLDQIFSNPYFALPLTLGIYLGSLQLYLRFRYGLLHPLCITIALLIVLIYYTETPYEDFAQGTKLIDFLLGPSVVALGYTLYEQVEHLRGRVLSILVALFLGAATGIVSVMAVAYLMGAGNDLMVSLAPKSVTTPIAMAIASKSGGFPALTAVVVVVTGILGSIIGPPLMKLMGIESKVAKGLALGAAAHGIGTSVAIQMGAIEGALGGLAIGIMGIMTALLVPLLQQLFL